MFSIVVTLIAGLSTIMGSLFVSKNRNKELEAFSLAFATGIMLMIALGELIPQSSETIGITKTLIFLAFGAVLSLLLDIVIPHHHHDEEETDMHKTPGHYIDECECSHHDSVSKGMIIALVLHNILEGLATGMTVFSNTKLGINMGLGIALHNIPIGTTLAVSLMSAGKKKRQAIKLSGIVGLSQPLGALIGIAFFSIFSNPMILSICMALVSGILIFISFDELWPTARTYGSRNLNIIALIIGICFIPLTELI